MSDGTELQKPPTRQVIAQLESTPDVLRLLAGGLSEAQGFVKPSATGWSVAEIVAHLAHTEQHCYTARVHHILERATTVVPAYDANRYELEGAFAGVAIAEGINRLGTLRTENIGRLRELSEDDLQRTATHESVGPFALSELLCEWAAHDVGHVRQIAIVLRDVIYGPHMGPFRE